VTTRAACRLATDSIANARSGRRDRTRDLRLEIALQAVPSPDPGSARRPGPTAATSISPLAAGGSRKRRPTPASATWNARGRCCCRRGSRRPRCGAPSRRSPSPPAAIRVETTWPHRRASGPLGVRPGDAPKRVDWELVSRLMRFAEHEDGSFGPRMAQTAADSAPRSAHRQEGR